MWRTGGVERGRTGLTGSPVGAITAVTPFFYTGTKVDLCFFSVFTVTNSGRHVFPRLPGVIIYRRAMKPMMI